MAKPISTSYTDEEKAEIIAHVLVNVACGRFVSKIFREDDMTGAGIPLPGPDTFYRWVLEDDNLPSADPSRQGLSDKLARAREYGIEALLDDAIVVSQTPQRGESHTIERIKPADMDVNDMLDHGPEDRVKTVIGDMTGHRKLYIETIFKAAQMLKPKKYGPKLDLTSDGQKLSIAEELEAARLRSIAELDKRK